MRSFFAAFASCLALGAYIIHQPVVFVPHGMEAVFVVLMVGFTAFHLLRPSRAL